MYIISKESLLESGNVNNPPDTSVNMLSLGTLSNSLSSMYLNVRALLNKMFLLENCTDVNSPLIIAVTKTWAKPEPTDGLYSIPRYNLVRGDRKELRRGGGVMIYVEKGIQCSSISLSRSSSAEVIEFACWKLQLTKDVSILLM